jgi:hypothetical protein
MADTVLYDEIDSIKQRLAAIERAQRAQPTGRLVCAWCGRVLAEHYPTTGDSHGICDMCYTREIASLTTSGPRGGSVRIGRHQAACVTDYDAAHEALLEGDR